MPTVSVLAHRLLNRAAALRASLVYLGEHDAPDDRKDEVLQIALRQLASMEDDLKDLIRLPREESAH